MPVPTSLLFILEFAFAYVILRTLLTANHLPWRYTIVPGNLEEMPYVGYSLPQARPAFVSPWSVEFLPNPVIFPTAVAMYAGCNAVRAALRTLGGSRKKENGREEELEGQDGSDRVEVNCAECGTEFRTEGLLRRHRYRKHVRRFACPQCGSAFHLKRDLDRHEQSVHGRSTDARPKYVCTHTYCMSPETVFGKKDNFDRHVKRCARRRGHSELAPVKDRKLVPREATKDTT